MAKFVLIDHSIADVGGHYYEYAVRVLRAAEEAGYEPVLATNRRWRHVGQLPWRVVPVYRNDFFGPKPPRLPVIIRRSLGRLYRRAERIKYRFLFSRLALWLSARRTRTTNVPRHGFVVLAVIVSALLYPVRLARAGTQSIRAAVHLGRVRRLFRFVRRRPRLRRPDRKHLLKLQIQAVLKRRAFATDSRRLFRQIALGDGDVVFIPTLAEADMLGLLPLFRSNAKTAQATWHLVFRRNIYHGSEPAYAAEDERQAWRKEAFRRFQSQLHGQRVFFYTDTDALTTQYNRLGIAVFQTLPIPVAADYQEAIGDGRCQEALGDRRWALGQMPASRSVPLLTPNAQCPTPRLLHVVYLGDARTEKGYHLLPHLVSDAIAARLPVRFTFQSNFNVPQGEPAAAVARDQLEAMTGGKGDRSVLPQRPGGCFAQNGPVPFSSPPPVELITQPLDSDEYRQLLFDADIVVIPYDRDNYYARSSGIFAEALAAGKPVIVPGGTWMAEQLSAADGGVGVAYHTPQQLFGCLREIVERYDHYRRAAAQFSRAWSHYHSPERLVKELLDVETRTESTFFRQPCMPAARRAECHVGF